MEAEAVLLRERNEAKLVKRLLYCQLNEAVRRGLLFPADCKPQTPVACVSLCCFVL